MFKQVDGAFCVAQRYKFVFAGINFIAFCSIPVFGNLQRVSDFGFDCLTLLDIILTPPCVFLMFIGILCLGVKRVSIINRNRYVSYFNLWGGEKQFRRFEFEIAFPIKLDITHHFTTKRVHSYVLSLKTLQGKKSVAVFSREKDADECRNELLKFFENVKQ